MTAPATHAQPVRQPQHHVEGKGLGRQYAADPRDRRFMLTQDRLRAVPRGTLFRRRTRPWGVYSILDQEPSVAGYSPNRCTVYAAVGQKQGAPLLRSLNLTESDMEAIYRESLKTDEFQGEGDEGTSERSIQNIFRSSVTLSRVLGRPVKAPFTDEYLWVDDEDMAREYLETRGMLLQGTDWLAGLDSPDKHGYVEPTGGVRGGHEYIRRWHYGPKHYKYPDTDEYVQSWGPSFGDKGLFRMKSDATKYLVQTLNGDLISAVSHL